jgi:hypothetical protein
MSIVILIPTSRPWRERPLVPVPPLSLLLLLQAFALLLILGFVLHNPSTFFHSAQTEWVRHERSVFGLLLLLDGEHRIFANLGCGITDSVGILYGNEVLVRRADLRRCNLDNH